MGVKLGYRRLVVRNDVEVGQVVFGGAHVQRRGVRKHLLALTNQRGLVDHTKWAQHFAYRLDALSAVHVGVLILEPHPTSAACLEHGRDLISNYWPHARRDVGVGDEAIVVEGGGVPFFERHLDAVYGDGQLINVHGVFEPALVLNVQQLLAQKLKLRVSLQRGFNLALAASTLSFLYLSEQANKGVEFFEALRPAVLKLSGQAARDKVHHVRVGACLLHDW